jgi:hypothetical protein
MPKADLRHAVRDDDGNGASRLERCVRDVRHDVRAGYLPTRARRPARIVPIVVFRNASQPPLVHTPLGEV